MYPLHDKDLDRLSRNAAEHYEVDFGSPGWEQLEKRLDQELPQKKKKRRFLFWLFFIVVTTGGALTGLLINSQPVTPLASNRMHVTPASPNVAATTDNNKKSVDQTIDPGPGDKKTNSNQVNVTKPTLNSNQQDRLTDHGTKTIDLNDRAINMNTITGSKKIKTRKPVNKYSDDISYDNPIQDQSAITQQPVAQNDNTVTTVPSTDQPANTTTATPKKSETPDSAKAEKKPPIPHRYKQPLELGLVAGPDASMVSFGPLYKAGYNFGITVGYRFNNRWSVNTGVIYTRKYYQADSNSFHAPKGSYWDRVLLHNVKGYCAMFDIPVNVRYDIAFNDKRRFFASTGVSSYFMKEQFYNYKYSYQPGDPPRYAPHGEGKDTQYLMSVLNLSVGYEKTIGKHFSIQAEPYLKIPLKGMGYGTMRMGSYGMFFSLKYRPTFKAKQPVGKK